MEEKKEGYNRYKVIFDNIKALCHVLGEPKEVIAGTLEGITEETCEHDCEHHILGNGLHVYIRDEYIYISENDIQYWGDERGRKGEELGQFYVSYNKEAIACICHADNGRPYSLVEYFNHEAEEANGGRWGRDNVFVPYSFSKGEEKAGGSGNVPADIGKAISQYLGENIQTDVRNVCNRIIALNEKIKEYEREPYKQEILKSEETLLELRDALQRLEEEIKGVDDNEIKGKVKEVEEKRLEIEYLERRIQKIRDEVNQMLDQIQVTDDITQYDAS